MYQAHLSRIYARITINKVSNLSGNLRVGHSNISPDLSLRYVYFPLNNRTSTDAVYNNRDTFMSGVNDIKISSLH